MRRVAVIGNSGAGKSTLATKLADRYGLRHLELDEYAQGPNWQLVAPEDFQRAIAAEIAGPAWVIDGNYLSRTSQTIWPLTDTIIWLDLPLRVVLPRLVRRSINRIRNGTELWNGNRERWSNLLGPDSVLIWAVRSHRQHRRELPATLARLRKEGKDVIVLHSAAEVAEWLGGLDRPAPRSAPDAIGSDPGEL